jgi:hypothetical protein
MYLIEAKYEVQLIHEYDEDDSTLHLIKTMQQHIQKGMVKYEKLKKYI